MKDPRDGFAPRHAHDSFMVYSNVFLAVVTMALIGAAALGSRARLSSISLAENRFITTEWRLLQALKADTDRLLMEKDRQISDLRRRYYVLVQDPGAVSSLLEVESQLRQAEEERGAILSQRMDALAKPAEAPASSAVAATRAVAATYASEALRARVVTLETQLAEQKSLVAALNARLSALDRASRQAAAEYAEALGVRNASLSALSARLAALERAADAAADGLRKRIGGLEALEGLTVEELATKALVRALISSPNVRAQYPGLLDAFDRYLVSYGLIERRAGRDEAYGYGLHAFDSVFQSQTIR